MNNGRDGELLFYNIMKSRNYQINDVSNNPNYWNKDIDFIIKSNTTGIVKSFEVKWDNVIYYTNNLFLEYYNPRSKQWNSEGWWEHCKADYLAYGDSKNKVFYIIPMKELKERVRELPYRSAKTADGAEGQLVSLGQIADIVQIL